MVAIGPHSAQQLFLWREAINYTMLKVAYGPVSKYALYLLVGLLDLVTTAPFLSHAPTSRTENTFTFRIFSSLRQCQLTTNLLTGPHM